MHSNAKLIRLNIVLEHFLNKESHSPLKLVKSAFVLGSTSEVAKAICRELANRGCGSADVYFCFYQCVEM